MDWYLTWVTESPLTSAAVQFALLGTLGEWLSFVLRTKRVALPCSLPMLAGKMAAWGVLGIVIKFGFVGMRGFVVALIEHHYVPEFLTSGVGSGVCDFGVHKCVFRAADDAVSPAGRELAGAAD